MASGRPWVRRELPWLRSGPLFRVDVSAEPDLAAFLDRFGYLRVDLNGTQMTSLRPAHDELARAFGFPDYYGHNWDAFNDSLRDYFQAHADRLLAVVWHNLNVAASQAPATTAEVGWALLAVSTGDLPTLPPDTDWHIATDVFVLGSGEDFDRPSTT